MDKQFPHRVNIMQEVVRNRSDRLLKAAADSAQITILRSLGYPVPSHLDRGLYAHAGYASAQLLARQPVAFVPAANAPSSSPLHEAVVGTLQHHGADVFVGDAAAAAEQGRSIVLDATSIGSSQDAADTLFRTVQAALPKLKKNTRLVFLADAAPGAESTPGVAAFAAGVQGFVRSLAKETGFKGVTANTVHVHSSALQGGAAAAAHRLGGPLAFLCRPQSAFVTAQALGVDGQVALPAAVSSATARFLPQAASGLVQPAGQGGTQQPPPGLRMAVEGSERGVEGPSNTPCGTALAGKVALVTGAARGLGAAIAWQLAASGAHVLGVDLPSNELALRQSMAALLGAGGSQFTGSVTSAEDRAELVAALSELYGGVDIVVHNAGITADRTLQKMKDTQLTSVLDVNLQAILALDEALGIAPRQLAAAAAAHNGEGRAPPPPAKAAGGGSIPPHAAAGCMLRPGGRCVYLSSINGIGGAFGQTNYAYTKSALMGYTASLARHMAPYGATANAVAPGFIDTDMTSRLPLLVSEAGRRMNALSQGGIPFDVGAAVAALALPESAGVTGQTLRVCGGHMQGR